MYIPRQTYKENECKVIFFYNFLFKHVFESCWFIEIFKEFQEPA